MSTVLHCFAVFESPRKIAGSLRSLNLAIKKFISHHNVEHNRGIMRLKRADAFTSVCFCRFIKRKPRRRCSCSTRYFYFRLTFVSENILVKAYKVQRHVTTPVVAPFVCPDIVNTTVLYAHPTFIGICYPRSKSALHPHPFCRASGGATFSRLWR